MSLIATLSCGGLLALSAALAADPGRVQNLTPWPVVALAVLGTLAVVGGIVWLMLRRAFDSVKAMVPLVERQNEVLRAVGAELGLAYTERPGAYGELRGVRSGVNLGVSCSTNYGGYYLEIVVPGRSDQVPHAKKNFPSAEVWRFGKNLFVSPIVPRTKVEMTKHRVILDPAELRRWIEDVANFVATH